MNSTDKPVQTPKRSPFLNMLAGYGSANALAQFMKMLFMLIMARYFGLTNYSSYVAAYSLASFTSIFFNLGLDTWLLREGSFQENWRFSAHKVLILKAGIGLLWAALLLGLAPLCVRTCSALGCWRCVWRMCGLNRCSIPCFRYSISGGKSKLIPPLCYCFMGSSLPVFL